MRLQLFAIIATFAVYGVRAASDGSRVSTLGRPVFRALVLVCGQRRTLLLPTAVFRRRTVFVAQRTAGVECFCQRTALTTERQNATGWHEPKRPTHRLNAATRRGAREGPHPHLGTNPPAISLRYGRSSPHRRRFKCNQQIQSSKRPLSSPTSCPQTFSRRSNSLKNWMSPRGLSVVGTTCERDRHEL